MRKYTALLFILGCILIAPAIVTASNVVNRATGNVNWNTASTWIQSRTGTVTFVTGSKNVTGVGTSFTTELLVGDVLMVQASPGTVRGTIASITDNTHLVLVANSTNASGAYGRQAVPTSADDVVIGNTLLASDVTITLNVASATVNSLTFTAMNNTNILTHTGSNALTITGGVTIGQPTGNQAHVWNINAGSASVGGSLTLGNTALQTNRLARVTLTTGSLSVAGNVVFNSATAAAITSNIDLSGGAAQLSIGGNLDLANDGGTITPGTTSTVTFNGTGTQTIEGGSSIAFSSLTVNKSSGAATLTTNQTIGGNLTVSAGTLDLSSFTANRTTAGGTLTVSNGTTLKIGGTNTFPTNYSTVSLGSTSTVEYSGTAQTVSNRSYGHLTLSNSGAKTMPGTAMSVAGDFTMNGTASATAAAAVNVSGSVAVNSGTTFNGGSYSHTVGGNWSAGGTFTPSTSTVSFNGTGAQSIGASPFNIVTIAKSSGTATATGNLAVAGNLSVTSGTLDLSTFTANRTSAGGSLSLSASTSLKIGGTNTFPSNYTSVSLASTSTVEYYGTSQSVAGQTYGHLSMSGGNTKTAAAASIVNGNLTIGSGTTFDAGSFSHQLKGNWSNAGSFTASTSTVTLNGSAAQAVDASTFNNLVLSNSANASLLGNVGVDGALTLTSGDIVTGSFTLTLGPSATISEASGATVLGGLATTRNVSQTTGTESFGGMGAVLTLHGTAPGSSSLTRTTGTASSGNGNTSILRKFAISPTINTGLLADLEFTYDASELNGRTASALELYKSTDNGSTWSNRGGVANAGLNKVTVSGLNGFSSWTASDPSNPLGAPPTPSVSSISPTSKSQGDSGFTLTVNGADFVSGKSTVRFNGSDRTTTYVNENQLTAAISASDLYLAGAFPITVFTTGSGSSGSVDLTVNVSTRTITATASAGGAISPSGAVVVNFGTDTSFTMTPNTGYHIDSVVADGVNLGAVSGHTFTNVMTNHTINAYFSINVYTITASASAGGSISPSGAVSVNYGTDQSFTVAPNTGYHIDSVVADGVNLGAVSGHTFTNVTANHTIGAYFSIDVFTVTAAAGANGSISPSGAVSVNYGASQAFTVTPNTGYHIDSVVADGVNLGEVSGHTFSNVTANHTIDAYFSINVYTLTSSASAGGSISPSGVVNVNYGGTQAYSVTASTGYHIDSVVADGVNLGAVSGHTFSNVTANHAIAAYFSIDVLTISASASAGGSISPSGAVPVNYGSDQSFTVTPNTGYHIDSVVADGANLGAVSGHTFSNVTANHTIDAYFSIDVFTLTSIAGANGSISPSGVTSADYGDTVAYSITPATGYYVLDVHVDSVSVGAVTNYAFEGVTANHLIEATFALQQFTISASASAGGSIAPTGAVVVGYGSDQSFTVTPNTGYHIDSVVADGVNLGAVSGHTFSNVTANHTIDAYFSIDVLTVTATAGAGGSISPSGAVPVNYGSDQSFTVTPNTGYHIDSVIADGANLGAVSGHTFSNVTANHAIDAYFSIDVLSITASASAGGSISPSGAVGVNYGDDQSFTVTPNTGYHIDSVVADGVNLGALPGHTFSNVTANHTIAAYFSIDVFMLTSLAGANGSISPSGLTSVDYGDTVTYTITPATGYYVLDVHVDSVSVGAVTTYAFEGVTANHLIEASFALQQFTITASASAGGSISPSGAVVVGYGSDQSFTVTPNTGYHIDSVVADGVNLGAVSGHTFSNVTANHAIAAYFSIDVLTITASASAGGSISPSGAVPVNYGSDQSFTVTPNTGYHIDSVVADGVNLGAVSGHTFSNVTANHSIAAYFSVDVFTVSATAGANGAISPSGAVSVNYGADQSFTVSPNTGYHIDSVVADGVNLGAVSGHTFSNVTANHSIAAYFSIDVFTVSASASAGGSISPSGAVSVNYGGSESFTVTPNTGYHTDSVVVDGVNLGAAAGHDFTNVTANHSISAYFSIDAFTISASASAGGSISPSGSVGVNYGGSQSFTVTPNTGYHTDSVVVDGVNLGVVASHDFTNVTANHSIAGYFSIDVFTVSASASSGGSITPSGPVSVNYGGSQSFTISPNTGYHIDSVVADGSNLGAVASHNFTNVTANHSIAAYFSIDAFTISASASAGGSISPSGAVGVNYGANQSFTVTSNTGYHTDSVVVDGVNLGAVASHNFTNVTAGHSIAAYFSINVFTVTASASAGGSISPSGAVGVNYGANQSFTVTSNTGYHTDSVVVDGVNLGAAASHDFTNVTANHTIAAYFSINVFTVSASASAGGSITPSGSVNVNYGASQLFTISPNTGYHIDSVVADGSNLGAVASHNFTNVTAGHSIAAYFSIDVLTITAAASAGGSISPSGGVSVSYGSNQSFTVTPNAGYHIDSVVADGVNLGAVASHDFTNVTTAHAINAWFSVDVLTITASASAGGSISPSGGVSVNNGSNQSFTISPNAGHHIDSVVADGVNLGTVTSYLFTNVTVNHLIQAYFSINLYAIEATAGPGGSISPAGTVQVGSGGSQAFTITPDSGYAIDSVLVDEAFAGNGSSYTFTAVAAPHEIRAAFVQASQTYVASSAWNLLSLPQHLFDNRTAALFPQASAPVYTFGAHGYEIADSVNEGGGYWVKLPGAQVLTIDGVPIRVDTIPVRSRWNIVGSVSAPVAVDDVVQDPPGNAVTEWFGYDDGYSMVDSILPGHAYWVKTAAAGSFTLDGSTSSAAAKSSPRPSRTASLAAFNKLVVSPSTMAGAVRSKGLWFGTDPEGSVDPERFELPPVPPAGAFDVRFGSQASLAVVPAKSSRWEMPLSIAAGGSDVDVAWSVRETDGVVYELVGRKNGVVAFRRSISGEGSIRIPTSGGVSYALTAGALPAAYALAQNYPNPFNPSTAIAFDLPSDARVSLEVFNAIGQRVATLLDGESRTAGSHTVEFNAASLPSGVYFYRIQTGSFSAMRKMVLMK